MTFWGGARLLKEGKAKAIVQPFDERKIDCSAYTLTLGSEAYVTPSFGDSPRNSVKQCLDCPELVDIGGVLQMRGGGIVVIPPGQFAFLLTEETISIPPETMGFISLKSKPKFGGLINVSGFHVDPGFRGKLIFSVFNAGPRSLQIARGDPLFLLWIADLSGEVQKRFQKTTVGYAEISSDLVTKVATENHSLQSLSQKVERLTGLVTLVISVATAMAIFLGLVAAWLALKPDQKEAHNSDVPKPQMQIIQSTPNPVGAPPLESGGVLIGQPKGPASQRP